MIKITSKFFWTSVAVVIAICLAPLTVKAITAGGMSISPVKTEKFPDRGGWFVYEQVEPGAVIEDVARVMNLDSKPATITVEAVDALMIADGGFALVDSPKENTDIGNWIELSKTEVTLGAEKEELIPFKITVPADAEVGDHIGGLAVYQTAPSASKTTKIGGSQVSISTRVGARLYLTVKGDIVRKTTLLKRSMFGRGQSLMFGFKIKNSGNIRADLRMTAKIYSIWGLYDKKENLQIGQIFPKKTINLWTPWPGKQRPIFGLYWASITIDDAFKGLNPTSKPLPPSTPIHTWVVAFFVPWTQVGILVLILFLVWFFIQMRKWRQMVALARTSVIVYKIKKGEHLMDIADRYGIGWKLLAKLNEIKPPYSLHGVAQIFVPDVRGTRRNIRVPRFLTYITKPFHHFFVGFTNRFLKKNKAYYKIVVDKGDTKEDIEKFTGTSWTEIAKYNKFEKSARPKVGQELKVPNSR